MSVFDINQFFSPEIAQCSDQGFSSRSGNIGKIFPGNMD